MTKLKNKYILQRRVLVFLEKQHLIGLLLQFLCVQKSALKIASNGHWPKFVGVFSNSVELGHFPALHLEMICHHFSYNFESWVSLQQNTLQHVGVKYLH